MRSERGLNTILHCLEWYKLVLRTRLPTPAVVQLISQSGHWAAGTLDAMHGRDAPTRAN